MVRIYVHRNYESFDNDKFLRILRNVRGTDITDVVCLTPWRSKYFHGRSELYTKYSKTYLERYTYRVV